ncbi:glycosyltransferase family 2 protein [Phocaeicola sp.]
MEERRPDISVITVNYNGFEDTREFIDSWVATVMSVSYEIIVVDNASKTNDAERLQQLYPTAIIIAGNKNLGFAGANNLGIKAAKGKYLFFLNNDVLMTHDAIQPLIERLLSDENIAGVSPLIRDYATPHAIQFAGYTPLSPITLRNKTIGEGAVDKKNYPATTTPYLHGAAMLLKKSVVDKLGGMPELFFLYYEELDWCAHITRNGYQLWYDPACEIIHKGSKSTGENSPLKTFYLSRNRLLYTYRNRSGGALYASILYQIAIVLPKVVITSIYKQRKDLAKAQWEGVKAFFKLQNKTE